MAQTRRITRANHSDLHAISENKISTERKTNEIWISTSAHLASQSTIVSVQTLQTSNIITLPLSYFSTFNINIEILILHHIRISV